VAVSMMYGIPVIISLKRYTNMWSLGLVSHRFTKYYLLTNRARGTVLGLGQYRPSAARSAQER